MTKKYLNVSYEDRDLAKRLGARWDPSVKKWYCMAGSPLAKIFTWRSAAASQTVRPAKNTSQLPLHHNFELPLAS
jgi:hypothetical protein